ncbi:MAG: hypothetical protein KDG50_08635 [Chromatiales bacterium]|nr:hypothetical protein [Chromatiales bacterium]
MINKFLLVAGTTLLPLSAFAEMKKKVVEQSVPVDSPVALTVLGVLAAVLAVRFFRKR